MLVSKFVVNFFVIAACTAGKVVNTENTENYPLYRRYLIV